MQQRVFIQQKQFTPQRFVDAGDSRQVTERVTGVILDSLHVVASHERHCDSVRELRNEADHLVVVVWRKLGNPCKSKYLADLSADILCFFRVFLGWNDDVVRLVENFLVRVLDAELFATCHRVGCDVFAIFSEHALDVVNYAALDTGYVRDERARLEILLIVANPFFEDVRIKRENHDVRLADHLWVGLSSALRDDVIVEGEFYRVGVRVDCHDVKPVLRKSPGIASADYTKSYYQNIFAVINYQVFLPQFQVILIYQKSLESSC